MTRISLRSRGDDLRSGLGQSGFSASACRSERPRAARTQRQNDSSRGTELALRQPIEAACLRLPRENHYAAGYSTGLLYLAKVVAKLLRSGKI